MNQSFGGDAPSHTLTKREVGGMAATLRHTPTATIESGWTTDGLNY